MFERITFDPNIMGGRACIRGMRITVSVIVGQLAHGASIEQVLDVGPHVGASADSGRVAGACFPGVVSWWLRPS